MFSCLGFKIGGIDPLKKERPKPAEQTKLTTLGEKLKTINKEWI